MDAMLLLAREAALRVIACGNDWDRAMEHVLDLANAVPGGRRALFLDVVAREVAQLEGANEAAARLFMASFRCDVLSATDTRVIARP